jgi:hypothetical protein
MLFQSTCKSLRAFNPPRKILNEIERTTTFDHIAVVQLIEKIRNLSEFLVYAEKFEKNYFE